IIFGAIMILIGLLDITMHDLVAKMYGFSEAASHVNWMGEIIGAMAIAIGVWSIITGRYPLSNINWLKFVITTLLLALAVSVHSILAGYVEFSQIGRSIIFYSIFAVAFLVLYPWRAGRTTQ
ncbi:MAG: hypothetical protein ACFE8Z_11735, partial [Candidatus Hermodarchaeota archaeon]